MKSSSSSVVEPVLSLTCGAVTAYPEVTRALSRPLLYDYDPVFLSLYEAVNEKARIALRMKTPPVILHGAPTLGLEAAAASLIAPGEKALNLVSGVYARGFGRWAKRYAGELVEIEVPFDQVIDPGQVEAAFKAHPDIRVVSVCHHDTPSGTINPLVEIGKITAAHGAYLIVDAVSSFGGMDIHPDDCHADVFVAAGQKCLGGAPGLALLGVSDRAWAKMKANPAAPRGSYLSILDWENAWRADARFPCNTSVSLIYALEAALDLYLEEGPAAVWARHARTARACRAGVRALGIELWPVVEATASPTTTAIRIPKGVDEAAMRTYIRERHRIMFSPGAGDLLGKLLRVAHMGPVAHPIYAVTAVAAIGSGIAAQGHRVDIGAGVTAAMQVADAAD